MGDHAAVQLTLSLILLLGAALAARGRLPTQLTTGGLAYEENVAARRRPSASRASWTSCADRSSPWPS
jgi:hypothetical protein